MSDMQSYPMTLPYQVHVSPYPPTHCRRMVRMQHSIPYGGLLEELDPLIAAKSTMF